MRMHCEHELHMSLIAPLMVAELLPLLSAEKSILKLNKRI